MKKKLASPRIHDLRAKLKALAERGVEGEQANARKKLQRLEKRYDFDSPNTGGTDIFSGVFIPEPGQSSPILQYRTEDYDIVNMVKWAIEQATQIPCLYQEDKLCAKAETTTANRLHDIAATVSGEMRLLWTQFSATPGVSPCDRGNFVLGLYEGMMGEERQGEQLPQRVYPRKVRRVPKPKGAVTSPRGLQLHPYSVAVGLGKRIRFSAPILDIAGELEKTIKGELKP